MTGERLITFLEDPAEMASVTYQEMKTLCLAYPYAASLRALLLLKSEQEKHWEKPHNLAMAALYAPDRHRIFDLMNPKLPVLKKAEVLSEKIEAVLELKPLATAEQEIAARKAAEVELEQTPAPAPVKAAEVPIFLEKKEPIFPENKPASKGGPIELARPTIVKDLEGMIKKSAPAQPLEIAPKPFVFSEWYAQFELPVLPQKSPRVSTKSIDNQPVMQQNPAQAAIEKKVEKPVPPNPAKALDQEKEREAAVKKLVKKSVKEKEEIASETLAKLYARQGYKDKAVAMYHKLMLVFPEKSATFAAEIEKLGR